MEFPLTSNANCRTLRDTGSRNPSQIAYPCLKTLDHRVDSSLRSRNVDEPSRDWDVRDLPAGWTLSPGVCRWAYEFCWSAWSRAWGSSGPRQTSAPPGPTRGVPGSPHDWMDG